MTKRRPLTWYDSDLGPTPDCADCFDYLTAPGFTEAIHSVAIERPESAATLARRYLDRFHAGRHQDLADGRSGGSRTTAST